MIAAFSTYLPSGRLTNAELVKELGRWTADEVFAKTGIRSRTIAAPNETAVDLAVHAVEGLGGRACLSDANFLLVCTQTADFKFPSSSCLIQARVGLPQSCACLDINLACSGFIYGLSIAEALVQAQAQQVILVNTDTYTHLIHPQDSVCRPIFGDGAAATLLTRTLGARVSGFAFGTDGSRAMSMSLQAGGARRPVYREPEGLPADAPEFIHMNGPEIYNFTLGAVPQIIATCLQNAGLTHDDIDYYILHQANGYMLEALRRKLKIPVDKFVVDLADTGNLVSASIPVVLNKMQNSNQLAKGVKTLLCGFGVGLSWAACVVEW